MITHYFRYDPERDEVIWARREFDGIETRREVIARWKLDYFRALLKALDLPPEPKPNHAPAAKAALKEGP